MFASLPLIYLAGLGVLLASIYLAGLSFRPRRLILGVGVNSLVVLILYAPGTVGPTFAAAGPHS
jgi:cation:H+ antiporter